MSLSFHLRAATPTDHNWILGVIQGGGADFIVSRGRKIFAAELPAFIAEADDGRKVGLITYEVIDDQCEVVTLDAFDQFSGIGTALLKKTIETARAAGLARLWLITTNDNLDAIRFYQRRNMTITAIHIGALGHSRRLKPSIPKIGQYDIPLRDEIEFEILL